MKAPGETGQRDAGRVRGTGRRSGRGAGGRVAPQSGVRGRRVAARPPDHENLLAGLRGSRRSGASGSAASPAGSVCRSSPRPSSRSSAPSSPPRAASRSPARSARPIERLEIYFATSAGENAGKFDMSPDDADSDPERQRSRRRKFFVANGHLLGAPAHGRRNASSSSTSSSRRRSTGVSSCRSRRRASRSAASTSTLFDDWARQHRTGGEAELGVATLFVPLHRVEKIFEDSRVGSVASYAERFFEMVGRDVREVLRPGPPARTRQPELTARRALRPRAPAPDVERPARRRADVPVPDDRQGSFPGERAGRGSTVRARASRSCPSSGRAATLSNPAATDACANLDLERKTYYPAPCDTALAMAEGLSSPFGNAQGLARGDAAAAPRRGRVRLEESNMGPGEETAGFATQRFVWTVAWSESKRVGPDTVRAEIVRTLEAWTTDRVAQEAFRFGHADELIDEPEELRARVTDLLAAAGLP